MPFIHVIAKFGYCDLSMEIRFCDRFVSCQRISIICIEGNGIKEGKN
jgi:hypothetical protein